MINPHSDGMNSASWGVFTESFEISKVNADDIQHVFK